MQWKDNLAKVEVASSSLVSRSKKNKDLGRYASGLFLFCRINSLCGSGPAISTY